VIGQVLLLREHERRLREVARGTAPGGEGSGSRRTDGS
jgi:hypothetical protein